VQHVNKGRYGRPRTSNDDGNIKAVLQCYLEKSEITVRTQMKFGTERIMHTLTSLFESLFCLTKLLNMATVRNSEAMLGQTLNHSVSNSLILCNLVNYLTC
jgi:hypothetical protein